MWGALSKNAQALASIAAEQAQKGLASANQLLEKLDGQLDGEEEEEEEEDDDYSEDGSRKEVTKETDSSGTLTVNADTDAHHHQASKTTEANTNDTADIEESSILQRKETATKKSQLEMSSDDVSAGIDKTIDDELDQLLFDDESNGDAAQSEERNVAVLTSTSNVVGVQSAQIIGSSGLQYRSEAHDDTLSNAMIFKASEEPALNELPVSIY